MNKSKEKVFSVKVSYNKHGLPYIKRALSPKLKITKKKKQIIIEGNKNGLLLLAKNLIGFAHTNSKTLEDGFHIHIDTHNDIEQGLIISCLRLQ
jgi:hypothetical protein